MGVAFSERDPELSSNIFCVCYKNLGLSEARRVRTPNFEQGYVNQDGVSL